MSDDGDYGEGDYDFDGAEDYNDDEFGQSSQYRLVQEFLFLNEIKLHIKSVQENLGINSGKAFWLIRHCKYDFKAAANPSTKLIDLIYSGSNIKSEQNNECNVCCEENNLDSLDCGHKFCSTCWKSYLETGIKQGIELGLMKRCPFNTCSGIQCPGKNCINLIVLNQFRGGLTSFSDAHFNVNCSCGTSFCSLCRDESHRPLSCEKFKTWNSLIGGKNSDDIDKMWIRLNTKACPKCKVDIEKNQGCMHMTCKKCTYEFCWLCMGDWKNHKDCNIYKEVHEKEQNKIKEETEQELKRYQFFSDRYIQHRKSIQFAVKKRSKVEKDCSEINGMLKEKINFEFLNDANLTIIECRRAVTYSYAMGYYIEVRKRPLLEFLQKDLETNLEKLDKKTDSTMKTYYDQDYNIMKIDFFEFQREVKSLTQTLNKYFGNMIDSFEKDLPELSKQDSVKFKAGKTNLRNSKNNKQTDQNDPEFETLPKWKCEFCGQQNNIEYVICEGCLVEKKK